MKKQKARNVEVEDLKDDARALVTATAHIVENKVVEARKRLNEAIGAGRETCRQVQEGVIERAKAADKMIRRKPYQTIGLAVGLGLLVGLMLRLGRSGVEEEQGS